MSAPPRRTHGRATSRIIALVVAVGLLPTCGCSYIFVNPPPEPPPFHERVDCTTNYVAPTIDILVGLAALVSFGIVESSGSKTQKTLVQIFGPPLVGGEIGTAIWGFRKVSACNDLATSHGPHPSRGYPRTYRPPAPSGIEPPAPPPEPGTEPPPPSVSAPTSAPPAPANAAPAPPAPPVRQRIDNE